MSEARLKLQARKDAVDSTRIGLQGGVYTGFTNIDVRSLEDAVTRYGVAQALLDGLATTEEGLAVRDILPDLDFLMPGGSAVPQREWIQPASGTFLATDANTATQVYKTDTNSNNTKKVLIIYGLREVQAIFPTSPSATTVALKSSAIIFKRSTTKTIDIWQIEIMETIPDRAVYGRTPILYKKGDSARIDFYPKRAAVSTGTNDFIILLGKVVEPIGENVVG